MCVPGGQEDHEAVWVSGASLLCCRNVHHQLGEWYRPLLLLHYLSCYLLSFALFCPFFCYIQTKIYFFPDFPLFLQPKTLFRRMGTGKKASKIKMNKNTTKRIHALKRWSPQHEQQNRNGYRWASCAPTSQPPRRCGQTTASSPSSPPGMMTPCFSYFFVYFNFISSLSLTNSF